MRDSFALLRMTNKKRTLLLIDGNNLFYRAYHALPPLSDKTGENANAVFGFSNMLLRATKEVEPTYIACAFDTKAPTFRHVEFEAYKAQRKPPPDDLYPQLPKVKSMLDAFGIAYFEKEGYEADDLLGTLAMKAIRGQESDVSKKDKKKNTKLQALTTNKLQVVILSGDRDLLQIVDGDIKVQAPGWNLSSTTLYGSKEVEEKFGITPEQMVDYKAITGDASDNIPGIAGIGPKTASALLQKYKTLEGIFKELDNDPVSLGSVADKLKAGKDVAFAAKKLIKLDTNVEISCQLSELRFDPDWEKVISEFERLGFKSIVSKIVGGKVKEGLFLIGQKANVSNGTKVLNVDEVDNDQLELI